MIHLLFQYCLEIFENSKQRDDHTCDGIENTGQQIICHKHPEKGPMIFTTQEQLFAHFAQEHTTPVGTKNLESTQNVSISKEMSNETDAPTAASLDISSAQEAVDESLNNKKSDEVRKPTNISHFQAKFSSELGGQQALMSKGIIAAVPQLQHSCPVCHKVGIIL